MFITDTKVSTLLFVLLLFFFVLTRNTDWQSRILMEIPSTQNFWSIHQWERSCFLRFNWIPRADSNFSLYTHRHTNIFVHVPHIPWLGTFPFRGQGSTLLPNFGKANLSMCFSYFICFNYLLLGFLRKFGHPPWRFCKSVPSSREDVEAGAVNGREMGTFPRSK